MNTPQDCDSDVLLCAFADEGAKESSICYSRAVASCVCAPPPARTEMIYHNARVPHLNLFQKMSITVCKYRIEIYFVLILEWLKTL